jgi:hypothetical protein
VIDRTGLGDPVAEQIAESRQVHMFVFTSQSKQKIMNGLAVAIHQRKIQFPEGHIVDELNNFEFEYTRSGVRYTAPPGLHDDCVCALAMAYSQWIPASTSGNISVW